MENRIKKSATACGIFATGMVAGFAASKLSGNARLWIGQLRNQINFITIPKILPAIPDFDKESISIEVDTHLRFNE